MKDFTIKSMLIVDDDRDDIYFFSKALETFETGIRLTTAGNGFEALDRLEEQTPDVILLDLNMPKMNGLTFLHTIKKMRHLKEIPVIIYTSHVNIFDVEELMESGAYAVFEKPGDFPKTVETINGLLQMNFIRMAV